jgi:glycosyltransferase involved in cell wall biosynthesis
VGTLRLLQVNAHGADTSHGGTEKHLELLGRELPSRGFAVSVLSAFPTNTPELFSRVTVLHRTHWQQDPVRRWRNHAGDVVSRPTRALAEAVAAHEPELVHTHNLPGISTAIWEVCRRLGVPVVHSLHDYHLLCPRVTLMRPDGQPCRPHPLLCGLRRGRLARWAGSVSHVIAVSRHLLDRHAGFFPAAETHVIRNPFPELDLARLAPADVPPSTIGYIGGLSRIKGVDALLAAQARLNDLGYTVHIAGSGPLRGAVEAAARSEGLIYRGVVAGDAKTAFLADCSLGIVPSAWEEPGSPTHALVEWLAAGRPVLVSDRGGLAEAAAVMPGTIPIDPSPAGIIEAAERLRDPAAAQAALERAGAPPPANDVERWVSEHEAVLRGALSGRPR